jgi:hypothetical protein
MESIYYLRKSFLSLTLLFFFTKTILKAQSISKNYVLTDFKQASVVIPFNERFQFENFRNGFVNKQSGKRSEAKLNYSYLFGDILFIGSSLDTLSISDVHLVKNVSIGESIYFYDKKCGFVEIIAEHDGVKIGKKRQLVLVDYEQLASFDRVGSLAAKPSQATFVGMPGKVSIENITNLTLRSQSVYFVIDKNNRFHVAERDSLVKVYARSKKKVLAYLNTHDIDYNNENDLKKAIEDCSGFVDLP